MGLTLNLETLQPATAAKVRQALDDRDALVLAPTLEYSTIQAGKLLGDARSPIRRLIDRGQLSARLIGNRKRIPGTALLRHLLDNENG